ncbi:hypothetical protein FQR65_LT10329 [Abscondita terminalis]|nr:hypothetical protein FQR65_LT10329 [Abscondita terminalis]
MKIICLSLILLQTTYAFEYKPASRVIEVIETGGYTFGFLRDPSINITKCTYYSDTGISGSFEIPLPSSSRRIKAKKNEVSELGQLGVCQLSVNNVDDKGPRTWTLKQSTEDLSFPAVNFTVNFFYKVEFLSDPVGVIKEGSFYQYINSNVEFQSCKVIFGTTDINLDVNLEQKGNTDKRVSSLGNGLCGFILTNASYTDAGEWVMVAGDAEHKPYKSKFKVNVFTPPNTKTTIPVLLGSSVSIRCGEEHSQDYCYLYNTEGKFVVTTSNDCNHPIKTVSLNDLGTWHCRVGKFPSMKTLDYAVELVEQEKTKVISWVTETNTYVSIGCQLLNYGEIKNCKMVSPSNEVLSLRSGVAYKNYLPFGTNFKNGTCALMIRKPLLDDGIGQWRCEISTTSATTGAFIHVHNSEIPSYNKFTTITTQLGEQLEIQCNVPYTSEFCYIISPNGTQHQMESNLENLLGKCSITIKKVYPEHEGRWKCYFARETGTPDEQITVEVMIAESLLFTTKVEASSGGNASIMCSSHGLPILYCRFISPNSVSYFIEDNKKQTNRITYKGRGLKYGDCGITITNVQTSESGIWTCITRVGSNYRQNEITATINLYVAPTFLENPATAIGFGTAAAIVVVTGLGFVGVKRWKKRRTDALLRTSVSTQVDSRQDLYRFEYPSYSDLQGDAGERHAHQP